MILFIIDEFGKDADTELENYLSSFQYYAIKVLQ